MLNYKYRQKAKTVEIRLVCPSISIALFISSLSFFWAGSLDLFPPSVGNQPSLWLLPFWCSCTLLALYLLVSCCWPASHLQLQALAQREPETAEIPFSGSDASPSRHMKAMPGPRDMWKLLRNYLSRKHLKYVADKVAREEWGRQLGQDVIGLIAFCSTCWAVVCPANRQVSPFHQATLGFWFR